MLVRIPTPSRAKRSPTLTFCSIYDWQSSGSTLNELRRMSEIAHSVDQVIITFPVTFPTTGPILSATGATCVVSAYSLAGGSTVAATTNVLVGDVCTSTWASGALAKGKWRVQLKMTIGGQPQVVADEVITVEESNP